MGESAWEIVTFTLNAILFTLIGLQLPGILDQLDAYSATDLLWWAVAIWLTRARRPRPLGLPGGQAPAAAVPTDPRTRPDAASSALALITWTGMRGAVSLAAALAIPLSTDAGEPFPGRDLILFLTFAVIFGTLVIQGLTLPAVIRLAAPRGRRRGRRARAGAGPDPRGERCPGAARGAHRGGLGSARHRRPGPRRLRLQAQPLLRLARRRRRRLDRGALARLPAAAARVARTPSGRR